MSEIFFPLVPCGIVVSVVMVFLWAVQLKTKDAGIVDAGWSYGLLGTVIYLAWVGSSDLDRKILLAVLVGCWAFRLGTYLLKDRVLAKEEDGRYQEFRHHLGAGANRHFFFFFQLQALFVVIFAIPFSVAAHNTVPLDSFQMSLAIALWLLSQGGEWLADYQLAQFRADPTTKGQVCQRGLWRYSRHPNYFFEWIHWFSYLVLSLGSPFWWLSLSGPVLMFWFLNKITGIPYTEKQALRSRGEAYKKYQQTTSAFFPWFPKG